MNLEIHSDIMIKRVWRRTQRPQSREFWGTLGYCNWGSLEIHFETAIERVWRDILGGHDHVNLKAILEWGWRCTWRPWSYKLEVRDHANMRLLLEALIEQVWRYTCCAWWNEFGDAHFELLMEWVWIYTEVPWLSKIRRVLGGCRWTARQGLRIYSSVKSLTTVGMWQGNSTSQLSWRAGWCRSIV